MTGWTKVLVGVALGLPMGAYAVGSLVASSADPPPARPPIILQDAPAPEPDSPPGTTPGAPVTPQPTPRVSTGPPEVVVPGYADRDDDDDDDRDEDDRDEDDRGDEDGDDD